MERISLFSTTTLLLSLTLALPCAAAGRKTVFLDNMGGFEAYIEKAAAQQKIASDFVNQLKKELR
jgi:hypothetical protein